MFTGEVNVCFYIYTCVLYVFVYLQDTVWLPSTIIITRRMQALWGKREQGSIVGAYISHQKLFFTEVHAVAVLSF